MIINRKYILAFTFIFTLVSGSFAQSTTNSPYSKFGVGNLKGSYLPQNRAIGNLAFGISTIGGYQNINVANPASYSHIRLTTFDVGASTNSQKLNRGSISEKSFNGSLNHLNLAIPVTKKSALSIGLLPYSNLGYQFKNAARVDTFAVDQLYTGEGGLSKAYLGYGFALGKHFSFGANLSYIFGNLKEQRSTEFIDNSNIGFLNARTENNYSVGGIYIDFGTQYITPINDKTRLTIGYAGGVKTQLNTTSTILSTRYRKEASIENPGEFDERRTDTTSFRQGAAGNLTLPSNHNIGFSIEKENKWLVGADLRLANWSQFQNDGPNQNLNNSWGFSVGGQIIPNVNAVTNYLKLMDYRFGVSYDKTFLTLKNTDIAVKSANFGLGFPLASNRSAFYKLNLTGEIGQRGTLKNDLVRENFFNIYIGFTINDRWFQKYKYD
jgi:hypothetical protein